MRTRSFPGYGEFAPWTRKDGISKASHIPEGESEDAHTEEGPTVRRLAGHQSVRDGVLGKIGGRAKVELFHDACLVKFNGLDGDAEDGRDLLERSPFGNQL